MFLKRAYDMQLKQAASLWCAVLGGGGGSGGGGVCPRSTHTRPADSLLVPGVSCYALSPVSSHMQGAGQGGKTPVQTEGRLGVPASHPPVA